jgi:hypothetical protein
MQFNFSVADIPQGLRFHLVQDANSMLFGIVSKGIKADYFRLGDVSALPVWAVLPHAAPAFVKTAEEAAAYMLGLLRAEIGLEGIERLQRMADEYGEDFAPGSIMSGDSRWLGEQMLALAFEYASGGRELMDGETEADDVFAGAIFDAFTFILIKGEG